MNLLTIALVFAAVVVPTPAPSPTPVSSPPAPLFTAPASWAQVPRGFALTEFKNLWQGPKLSRGRGGFFGEAVLPVPAGLVNAGLAQLRNSLAHTKSPLNVKTTSSRVCGSTASVSTMRVGKGASAAIVESTLFSKNALTYAALYFRPLNASPAAIETALRAACPLPNGDLPSATPPAGWNALNNGIDAELSGIWLGNGPMQVMTLVQGHQIPDPEMVANMFQPMIVKKNGQVKSRINTRHLKFCGQDGVLVDAQFIVPPGFGFTYDLASVQGTAATYLLAYMHPTSYTDAAAQQSLLTLCGGPAPKGSTPGG